MAGGELGEDHHDGRCVVVHGDGGLGAGKRADEVLRMVVAASARHVLDAVFERGVKPRWRFHHGLHGGLCQHAAPRLVWMTTPVALMTRLRLGRSVASAPLTASVKIASTSTASTAPAKMSCLLPVYRRTGAVDEHGTGTMASSAFPMGGGISSSTWGNARKGRCVVRAWVLFPYCVQRRPRMQGGAGFP